MADKNVDDVPSKVVTNTNKGPVKEETKSLFSRAIDAVVGGVTDNSGGTGRAEDALSSREEKLKAMEKASGI